MPLPPKSWPVGRDGPRGPVHAGPGELVVRAEVEQRALYCVEGAMGERGSRQNGGTGTRQRTWGRSSVRWPHGHTALDEEHLTTSLIPDPHDPTESRGAICATLTEMSTKPPSLALSHP